MRCGGGAPKMKPLFGSALLSFFLTTLPLLACPCSADGPRHSINAPDQHQGCCHSDQARVSARRPQKPCCTQCLPPVADGDFSKAVFSKTIQDSINPISLQTTRQGPIAPELNQENIFIERNDVCVLAVFQSANAPRAPPQI